VKHDVPATLAVVLAYLAIARIWTVRLEGTDPAAGGRPVRNALLAGAACGVPFSTPYYCILLEAPLTLAIVWTGRADGIVPVIRRLAAAAAACAAVFFLLSPFILAEPLVAWRDITANRQIVIDRAVASGAFAPARQYARMLWLDSMGIPVVILAAIGIVWMLVSSPARAVLLLAFPVPFLIFIANTAPASRYLNPVLPFLALFAGWTLSSATARMPRARTLFWLAVVAAAAPGAIASVRTDLFIRQADTRTLAKTYVESHIPPGSGVLIQPYSVPLTMSRQGLLEALTHHLGSAEAASTKFQLQLSLDPYPSPAYRLIYLGTGGLDVDKIYISPEEAGGPDGLLRLRRLGVAFVVLKRYNRPDSDTLPLLGTLNREGRRIAAFSPYRSGVTEAEQARIDPFLHNTDTRIDEALARPGPPLEIWQIDGPGLQ
jgi:hypothetical protein